jgi:hypothetical protein
MTIEQIDLIAGWASLVLTLMVFSYILADNVLYRLAVHILVGAAAGYAAVAATLDIIVPWFRVTLTESDAGATVAFGLIPLLLFVFLVLKLIPRYAHLGNAGLLYMVAVGAGVALIGAVLGTIIPLVSEAGTSLDTQDETINGMILIVGTVTTLIYFQYLSRRNAIDGQPRNRLPVRTLRYIGQGFISVTLGALYAQAILTSLVVVNELVRSHLDFIVAQLGG